MKHTVNLLTGLAVQPIIDKLEALPELWNDITIRQDYPGSAHTDTECIFIRGPETLTPEKYFNDLGSYNYPASMKLRDELAPLINAVSAVVDMQENMRITTAGFTLCCRQTRNARTPLVAKAPTGRSAPHGGSTTNKCTLRTMVVTRIVSISLWMRYQRCSPWAVLYLLTSI